ncbi:MULTISPECIES: cytochrome P450 [Streptosporangium]|uniref:Cytochrome P450 n=1 Tax=Streptosporangium brasiliense TaxID=47480 RepID=A0ABT9RE45_9ACTN|nr:cytochrome P450 [Streptosporangium brasiliense]MDP9867534.1 cytochrome P450 [Streptosporangium brasiliense]
MTGENVDAFSEPVDYPFGEPVRLDIDPEYARCRERPGLVRVRPPYGDDAWLVTRYRDIRSVLRDRRFVRTPPPGGDEARLTPLPLQDSILNTDPPQQTRLRKAVAGGLGFNTERVHALEATAERHSRRLMSTLLDGSPPLDLVDAYVKPLVVEILCPVIGIPEQDLSVFLNWFEGFASTALPADVVEARVEEISCYTDRLIADRRDRPRDDLISVLADAAYREKRLTEAEVKELVNDVLLAIDNVTTQLTNAAYLLITSPGHMRELKAEPELIPQAVEELLRYAPFPSHVTFARYATEDIDVGGTLVRAGEQVLPALPAGNHDPSAFPSPGELDFRRKHNPHLSFGHGMHHCMGPPLVRMLMRVAVLSLTQCPSMRLAVPEERLAWRSDLLIRRVESLPVTW